MTQYVRRQSLIGLFCPSHGNARETCRLSSKTVALNFSNPPVSGIWQSPARPRACYVMAHGAGAGMRHALMETIASGLVSRGVACMRYQFPYMERGSKRPDPPKVCHITVRDAVAEAAKLTSAALFAGGRSFGGRMTSQAQALAPLPGVRGLAFLGFPLHAAKKPSIERAKHLEAIQVPMLFLQGTQDELAALQLLQSVTQALGKRASLTLFEQADHAFHAPKRSGKTDEQRLQELIDALAAWLEANA
jgi:predicted alpha/beta-hydrolase family hydrolase